MTCHQYIIFFMQLSLPSSSDSLALLGCHSSCLIVHRQVFWFSNLVVARQYASFVASRFGFSVIGSRSCFGLGVCSSGLWVHRRIEVCVTLPPLSVADVLLFCPFFLLLFYVVGLMSFPLWGVCVADFFTQVLPYMLLDACFFVSLQFCDFCVTFL